MATASPLSWDISFEKDRSICVIALRGKLDALAVEEFQPKLDELRKQGHTRFVFDLAHLDYVGSFGLRIFVALHNEVHTVGHVCVCNVSSNVRSIFSLTKLDKILRSYPSRADAVDAVASRGA